MPVNNSLVLDVQPFGPLTFVFYEEEGFEGLVGSHCVELDIGGQGANREAATEDLKRAIETYVLYHAETGEPMEVRRAPPEIANLPDRITLHLLLVEVRTQQEEPPRRQLFFTQPPREFTPALAPL